MKAVSWPPSPAIIANCLIAEIFVVLKIFDPLNQAAFVHPFTRILERLFSLLRPHPLPNLIRFALPSLFGRRI
jgi:hypothetical protein